MAVARFEAATTTGPGAVAVRIDTARGRAAARGSKRDPEKGRMENELTKEDRIPVVNMPYHRRPVRG
jgi:hypothetical protein